VTITKAISIQGHGYAAISAPSGQSGIVINAGTSDSVNLNGVLVDGNGAGVNGIVFGNGKSLTVENCAMRDLTQNGIIVSGHSNTLQTLAIANSEFSNNSSNGIFIGPLGSGEITASIDRNTFSGNGSTGLFIIGVVGTAPLNVEATDNTAIGNGWGFVVQSSAGHSVSTLVLTRITASGNGVGVEAFGANATLLLAQSTVTANNTGYEATSGGVITSYRDNIIDDNGTNAGTLGSASKQ
jgi:hypothetical protein